MPVRDVERLVQVQHGLHRVFAGGDVAQALGRVPEHRGVEDDRRVGAQAVDVDTEHLRALDGGAHLEARLALVPVPAPVMWGEEQEQASVRGLGAGVGGETDDDPRAVLRNAGSAHDDVQSEKGDEE